MKRNVKIGSLIGILCICLLGIMIKNNTMEVYATPVEEKQPEKVAVNTKKATVKSLEDVLQIIEKNNAILVKEEVEKQVIDVEYTTKYQENSELPKGTMQVIQDGSDGKQTVVVKRTYENDEISAEEILQSKTTSAPIMKIVEIGTSSYRSSYKPKVGDVVYATATLVPIRIEPSEDANKLITIYKNNQVTILQIQGDWYEVQYGSYVGWANKDCFTYISAEDSKTELAEDGSTYSKSQLLNTLSFNMKLNKKSGLSLAQFKKIFEGESKDSKKVFANNAQYFYYAEKQYNVNGVFIAAVAVHESGWGTSKMAQNKKNLFGYGAYDRNPSDNAYVFSEYSEGIDLLGRVFAKYYLNPKGTKIYGGEVATGSHYNGPTVSGVNKKYASDKNWANNVYKWMSYLYNRL